MSNRIPTGAALLMAGALLAAPIAAFAQTSPSATTSPSPQASPSASPSAAASTSASAQKRNAFIERRISELRTQIKVTPDEEKSFDDFTNVMRQNAAQIDTATAKGATLPENATALARMQAYADVAQTHADNVQHLTTAFTAFYNTLTPQQKKVVDASFAEQAQKAAARRATRS